MELFFSQMSGNSARAVFALFESGADWTRRQVDPRAGETRTPDYLGLNPMGKIPALRDGAFVLWESNAINWYVAEKHPGAALLPASLEARAGVQRWQLFQTGHVSPACFPIFRLNHARMKAFWKSEGDPRADEVGRKELARFLPVLESALDGRAWLEGSFSLADIAFAPHFALLAETDFDFSPYPRLSAWLQRLLARPAWKETARLVFESV